MKKKRPDPIQDNMIKKLMQQADELDANTKLLTPVLDELLIALRRSEEKIGPLLEAAKWALATMKNDNTSLKEALEKAIAQVEGKQPAEVDGKQP